MLHAIPPATIFLIRKAWFQEAADILTPGNITIVFMAWPFFVGESCFSGGHVSLGDELFVLNRERKIGLAGQMIRVVLSMIVELCG